MAKISVVPIPQARQIGVDPRQLLDGVPPEMGELRSQRPSSEAVIEEAEKDLVGKMEDAMHDKVIIDAKTISMKEQEVDE